MVPFLFVYIMLYCFSTGFGSVISSNLLPDTETCGRVEEKRIIGGSLANLGEFPWMALISSEDLDFYCGGSLINNRYVLTAAHCVDPKRYELTSVRLGEYNLSSPIDCDEDGDLLAMPTCSDDPIDIPVKEVIVHEDYNRRRAENTNDIALIRLDEDVTFTKYIKPICLPTSKLDESYIESKLTVAGWGKTENDTGSPVILKLEVPIKPNNKCPLEIGERQLCAGGVKGMDSCVGDSGGPLMFHEEDEAESNWYAIGIVSYGLTVCALEDVPGVYTRVANYIPWIISKLEP